MDLRLTATVAPYLEAIRSQRLAGWRWRDVRAALGLQCSDHAIAQAVRRCPWKAEQLPLPDPDATSAKISTGTASSNSGGQHAVAVIDYGGFGKTERAKPRFDDDK